MIYAVYDEVFNSQQPEAFVKYALPSYIQHNPGVTSGRQGFIDTFRAAFDAGKKMVLKVLDIIEEDDMVFVYLMPMKPDGSENPGHTVMDIYRLEDGKLAEHWDVLEG